MDTRIDARGALRDARARSAGFTLIEVMVVIAIIATLVGVGSLMISVAMKKKAVMATQGTLVALGAALEQLKGGDQLGRYPPTHLNKLVWKGFDGAKSGAEPNDVNVGIEAVYVAFRLDGISISPQGVEDAIGNTDEDSAGAAPARMQKPDLFEFIDAWGNPLAYFNSADFKDAGKGAKYKLANGEVVEVAPKKNATTGDFVRAGSYQLFSFGPDGVPGTEDDVEFGR